VSVQKSKIAFISIVSILLLLSFQNCGQQLVTISSVNSGYQEPEGTDITDSTENGSKSIEEAIKRAEVTVVPMIAVEGKSSKVSFKLNQKLERSIDIVLKPLNELALEFVERKQIVTKHSVEAGLDSVEFSLPAITLSNYKNQKNEFEVSVSDEKLAFVSSKSFNVYIIPETNADGAASITLDDQVTASSSLKGSVVLLTSADADATIDWEILGGSTPNDLKLFPATNGTISISVGHRFVSFSILTLPFQDYMLDKNFTIKFTGGRNVKLVEPLALGFKLIDQKPHSAPTFTKMVSNLISKDFKNGVKLSVLASGTPTPTYEWYVNGQRVSGAAADYTLPSPAEAKQFVVKVVAKNIFGEATSSDATIAFGCANNESIKNGMCEVNTVRECAIAFGIGQQTWMADRWSDCMPISCNTGFEKQGMSCACPKTQHLQGNSCVNNSMSCGIANGTGVSVWNGTSYGACTLVSCNSSFSAFGNTCACQVDQTLDTTDNLCKYKVKKWEVMASYDSIAIPVRCSGSYKPFSRPVNGVYSVGGIIIAGGSPWPDPRVIDPNFTVSAMRVIESSTCGAEFLDGGYPGTNTLCYSRNCAMKMYRVGEGLSLTK